MVASASSSKTKWPSAPLQRAKRPRGRGDRDPPAGNRCCPAQAAESRPLVSLSSFQFYSSSAPVTSAVHASRAASLPDRIAPSMVAGRPVAVQSPARKRFRQRVCDRGRLAFSSGSAAKVARRSLMMCQGGKTAGKFGQPYHVIPDILCEHLAGGLESSGPRHLWWPKSGRERRTAIPPSH